MKEIEECGGRILLSTPASKITLNSNDVCVTAQGKDYPGNWVVVAVPPSCWNTMELPFDTAPYSISTGPAFKFLAETKKRFWMRDSLQTAPTINSAWSGKGPITKTARLAILNSPYLPVARPPPLHRIFEILTLIFAEALRTSTTVSRMK
jgi:hypothetical protein